MDIKVFSIFGIAILAAAYFAGKQNWFGKAVSAVAG